MGTLQLMCIDGSSNRSHATCDSVCTQCCAHKTLTVEPSAVAAYTFIERLCAEKQQLVGWASHTSTAICNDSCSEPVAQRCKCHRSSKSVDVPQAQQPFATS